MRFTLAALALPIGFAVSQGVTSAIAPKTSAPAGCSPDYSGQFQIQVVNVTKSAKREVLERRKDGQLLITLAKGVLTDDQGRTGYIADNQQFQFDAPAQTGAIYTAGWSVCSNGSLAIGNDAIFYQCLSGTFYNLYDEATAAQCSPVYIEIVQASSSGAASAIGDGQVTASPKVSQLSDGQPQATTGAPKVTQLSDGQPQLTTGKPNPVTQISDGQPQGPTGTPSPITSKPATSSVAAPVTVKSDGQPVVPTGRNATLSTGTPTASPVATYTGAAAMPTAFEFFGLAAGALALAFL